MLVYKIDIILL